MYEFVVDAPYGFTIRDGPFPSANTVSETNSRAVVKVKGTLIQNGRTYYVTKEGWKRFRKEIGLPDWVEVKPKPMHRSTSTPKSDRFKLHFNIVEYEKSIEISTPSGITIKEWPRVRSDTVAVNASDPAMLAKAHIDTAEGRFYMSKWSWERMQKGERPNWVILTTEVELPTEIVEPRLASVSSSSAPINPSSQNSSLSRVGSVVDSEPDLPAPARTLSNVQTEAILQICGIWFGVAAVDYLAQDENPFTAALMMESARYGRNVLLDGILADLGPNTPLLARKNFRAFLCKLMDGNFDSYAIGEAMLKVTLITETKARDEDIGNFLFWTVKTIDFLKRYQNLSAN